MKDLVSIIVPVYNAGKYVKATVMSVVNQTYENLEILLVDDGGKDATGRIRVLLPTEHGTAARARNYGISHAQGRYIAFLDADDLWEKCKLEKEMQFMQEKNAGFVFTGYEFAEKCRIH